MAAIAPHRVRFDIDLNHSFPVASLGDSPSWAANPALEVEQVAVLRFYANSIAQRGGGCSSLRPRTFP
jgi:hypothetical protein